jgi:hypothetical protein
MHALPSASPTRCLPTLRRHEQGVKTKLRLGPPQGDRPAPRAEEQNVNFALGGTTRPAYDA